MRLLSRNCRGLGNPETVRELRLLVKKEDPQVVFLSETCLEVSSIEWIRIQLGMRGALGLQRLRYGGGLTLLWSQTLICLLKVTLSVILMQLLSFLIVCHGDSRDFTRIRKPTKERSHGSYFAVWLNLTPSPGLCVVTLMK